MDEYKLFDPKFVRFMWDDELEGKEGYTADDIGNLQDFVNEGDFEYLRKVHANTGDDFGANPFNTTAGFNWRFFYYDPNYEVKRAYYKEGKQIQIRGVGGSWIDIDDPKFLEEGEYRVKPEEEKWITYLCRGDGEEPYLSACTENYWEFVQEDYGAKTKLFVGTEDECTKWYEARQKLAAVIEAWEDGKKVQVKKVDIDAWVDCDEPLWCKDCQYRVKPEEEKPKRMTCRQLSEWLAKGNGQWSKPDCLTSSSFAYDFNKDEHEVSSDYKIRYWGCDEWIEPTEREYLVSVKHVNPDMSPAEWHNKEEC